MSSKIENERKMKIMFTKEELQYLKAIINTSLKSTKRRIKNLEEKQEQITEKQKDMLEGFKKSREFKQNLIAKLEKLEGVAENGKGQRN